MIDSETLALIQAFWIFLNNGIHVQQSLATWRQKNRTEQGGVNSDS